MVKYSLYKGKLAHPLWKGVMLMTAYETISLMIAFGMLIAVLSKKEK
ncbi:putative holin-like toxin [Bacillus haynesii]|nr:putative holin-like toxin [Bacillus haynesii]